MSNNQFGAAIGFTIALVLGLFIGSYCGTTSSEYMNGIETSNGLQCNSNTLNLKTDDGICKQVYRWSNNHPPTK